MVIYCTNNSPLCINTIIHKDGNVVVDWNDYQTLSKSITKNEPETEISIGFPEVVGNILNYQNLHENVRTVHMTSLENRMENFSETLSRHINEYHEVEDPTKNAIRTWYDQNQMNLIMTSSSIQANESYFNNTTTKFQKIKPLIKRDDKHQLSNHHVIHTGKRGRPKKIIIQNLYKSPPRIKGKFTDEVKKTSPYSPNIPTYYKFNTQHFEENGHYTIKVDNSVGEFSYQDPKFKKFMENGNIYNVVERILQHFLGQDLSYYNLSGKKCKQIELMTIFFS